MSLSPLYPSLTIDLHVRIASSFHQSFPWLHSTQAKFTIFRVPAYVLPLKPARLKSNLLVGDLCFFTKERIQVRTSLSLRVRSLLPSNTCTYGRLLGPCFETGWRRRFRQHLGFCNKNVPHSLLCHVVGLVTVNVMNKSTQLTTLYHQKLRVIRVMLTVPCRLFNKKKTRRTHSAPSLPFQQVQVLFHSLFKVLFIFPSRYLFAIGLPPIFSFRWNLPPNLNCIPKQFDSKNSPRTDR